VNRIVLDTKIVVSAFLWGGTSRQVITEAIQRGDLLLVTDDMLRELENTLNKPKFDLQLRLINKTRAEIIGEYRQVTVRVAPLQFLQKSYAM